MRIEAVRQAIEPLAFTPRVLASLRETARLFSTHYSTAIEGNRLTQEQVIEVIGKQNHFPGRERDQDEVRGYYAAIDEVNRLALGGFAITEISVRRLHALVMKAGKTRVAPTPYRDGQNVIRDSVSRRIVYLPPEANDVGPLMRQLLIWVTAQGSLPVPLKAAIAHYQFATIHPYYDGNGRTARLLTTLILHVGGYGLKGLYSLEEYYARDLKSYYQALTVGASHNYYLGRAEADITKWITYCIEGMAIAFEKVYAQAKHKANSSGQIPSALLRRIDARQRIALSLFKNSQEITARDIGELFGIPPRSSTALCQRWVKNNFLMVADPSKKSRRYRLSEDFETFIAPT